MNFDQIKTELEVCQSETDRMSDWEKDFVESISDQFTNRGTLSEKQQEILHRIYDKVA